MLQFTLKSIIVFTNPLWFPYFMDKKYKLKKKLQTIVSMILSFVTFANAQNLKQKDYIIEGEVKGINSGLVKMLSEDKSKAVDSTALEKGIFNMHGNVGMPEQRVFQIFTKDGTWSFMPALRGLQPRSLISAFVMHDDSGGGQISRYVFAIANSGNFLI